MKQLMKLMLFTDNWKHNICLRPPDTESSRNKNFFICFTFFFCCSREYETMIAQDFIVHMGRLCKLTKRIPNSRNFFIHRHFLLHQRRRNFLFPWGEWTIERNGDKIRHTLFMSCFWGYGMFYHKHIEPWEHNIFLNTFWHLTASSIRFSGYKALDDGVQ